MQLAGSVAGNDLSLIGLFLHADIVGKIVITGLLMISILTWAIIFDKMIKLRGLKDKASAFRRTFLVGGFARYAV